MNKEILEKVDNIVNYIKESKSYQNYLKSQEILSNQKDLLEIIDNIKKVQKEFVKNPKNKELQFKLEELNNKLQDDITYNQYNEYLKEVNNMLAIFENKINKYFDDVFN